MYGYIHIDAGDDDADDGDDDDDDVDYKDDMMMMTTTTTRTNVNRLPCGSSTSSNLVFSNHIVKPCGWKMHHLYIIYTYHICAYMHICIC